MRLNRLNLLLCLLILFQVTKVSATPVQIDYQGVLLNANLQEPHQAAEGPLFLLVHGTWAHGGMEIMAQLQNGLADAGYRSLAITLSLGVNDRQGFMSCDAVIKANHADAAAEINQWVEFSRTLNDHIVLIGHSRGGNQVMLYQRQYSALGVDGLVLIAPMTWRADESAVAYEAAFGQSLGPVVAQAEASSSAVIKAGILNCPQAEVLASSFLSYYGAEPNRNTPALLSSVKRPVLVFEGTEDPLAAGFIAQVTLFESNPNVTVQWVDGADHFFRDLFIDDIIDGILEWLPQ